MTTTTHQKPTSTTPVFLSNKRLCSYITNAIDKLTHAAQHRRNLELARVLSFHWNASRNDAYPSQQLLAAYLDVSVRTISRRLKELENAGVLTVKRVFKRPNVVSFNMKRLRQYAIDAFAENFKIENKGSMSEETSTKKRSIMEEFILSSNKWAEEKAVNKKARDINKARDIAVNRNRQKRAQSQYSPLGGANHTSKKEQDAIRKKHNDAYEAQQRQFAEAKAKSQPATIEQAQSHIDKLRSKLGMKRRKPLTKK
ncbi:helix-turn-helix domain-containing protein [Vibrio astriarenae]